jgi:hypothetical protein
LTEDQKITPRPVGVIIIFIVAMGFISFLAVWMFKENPKKNPPPLKTAPKTAPKSQKIDPVKLKKSCSRCHAFPEPKILPKLAWAENIQKMYQFIGMKGKALDGFLAEEVIDWYESRAPDQIKLRKYSKEQFNSPVKFQKHAFSPPNAPPSPAISQIQLIQNTKNQRPYAVFSDMRHHLIMKVEFPSLKSKTLPFIKLASVPYPCRTVICDLDGDNEKDILVADLGSFRPMDHKKGLVAVFKVFGSSLKPIVLAKDIGRVSDIRSVDLDGDKDLDVLVSVFGWHHTGKLMWLENRTEDWSQGQVDFVPHTIDTRHGVIHTPVHDFNKDGKPDFLALFSQEFEEVALFTNQGGQFKKTVLDKAPHPAWGSNGLLLVDLDQDGDQDALVSNGDTLDDLMPKNDHGLRWLENKGSSWEAHDIAKAYGIHGAKVGDLDNDGDLDIVAAAFLPQFNPDRDFPGYIWPSLMWFEQVKKLEFKMWILESRHCVHASLDIGDIDLDGDLDIVAGSFTMALQGAKWDRQRHWIEVWENKSR